MGKDFSAGPVAIAQGKRK